MKKNLYFRQVYRRENVLKDFIYAAFYKLASYPRMLIEVFIRRNFGQRYFSPATAVTIMVVLFLWPVMVYRIFQSNGRLLSDLGIEEPNWLWAYSGWYLLLVAFGYFAYLRYKEIKQNPSVFDFGRFSLCTGDIHPLFYKLKIFGKTPSIRKIEIWCEPALFFLIGLLLGLTGQRVGGLLMDCSILYALSYAAAYKQGDDFVMDKIDETIMNEELENAFVNDATSDNTRGVRFYSHKPDAKSLRRKVAESMIENSANSSETVYAK